jgi:hypothetical protein
MQQRRAAVGLTSGSSLRPSIAMYRCCHPRVTGLPAYDWQGYRPGYVLGPAVAGGPGGQRWNFPAPAPGGPPHRPGPRLCHWHQRHRHSPPATQGVVGPPSRGSGLEGWVMVPPRRPKCQKQQGKNRRLGSTPHEIILLYVAPQSVPICRDGSKALYQPAHKRT